MFYPRLDTMNMLHKLAGGDRRSIGRVDEVVADILGEDVD